jgi:hypothetical protein
VSTFCTSLSPQLNTWNPDESVIKGDLGLLMNLCKPPASATKSGPEFTRKCAVLQKTNWHPVSSAWAKSRCFNAPFYRLAKSVSHLTPRSITSLPLRQPRSLVSRRSHAACVFAPLVRQISWRPLRSQIETCLTRFVIRAAAELRTD